MKALHVMVTITVLLKQQQSQQISVGVLESFSCNLISSLVALDGGRPVCSSSCSMNRQAERCETWGEAGGSIPDQSVVFIDPDGQRPLRSSVQALMEPQSAWGNTSWWTSSHGRVLMASSVNRLSLSSWTSTGVILSACPSRWWCFWCLDSCQVVAFYAGTEWWSQGWRWCDVPSFPLDSNAGRKGQFDTSQGWKLSTAVQQACKIPICAS